MTRARAAAVDNDPPGIVEHDLDRASQPRGAPADGGARHWAVLASLIETAKLNGSDPQAWMTWAIAGYVDGYLQSRLDELLRWNDAKTVA